MLRLRRHFLRSLLAFAIAGWWIHLPLSHANLCSDLQHDQASLNDYHDSKAFNTTRPLSFGYSNDLGDEFMQDLNSLRAKDVWLDAGGGEGNAVSEYLSTASVNPKASVTMVSLATSLESAPGLKVLKGRLIENIPIQELGTVSLISDVYGPFAYSSHPLDVISTYLQILKTGGKIYFAAYQKEMIVDSVVFDGLGRPTSLVEMIKSIPEVKVEVRPGTSLNSTRNIVVITKLGDVAWSPPELRLLYHSRSAPPIRIWADSNWTPNAAEATRARWVEAAPKTGSADWFGKKSFGLTYSSFGTSWFEKLLMRVKPKTWLQVNADTQLLDQFAAAVTKYNKDKKFSVGAVLNRERVKIFPELRVSYRDHFNVEPRSQDLITDTGEMFLINSGRPDQVLKKYLDALSDRGSLLIEPDSLLTITGMGTRVILPESGGSREHISLRKWIEQIPGLTITAPVPKTDLMEIRIKDRRLIKIPELIFISGLSVSSKVHRAAIFLQK